MASKFAITEDEPAVSTSRFAITEDEPIEPVSRFAVPQTVIDGSQELVTALPDEARLLADDVFSLTNDPNSVKTDLINTSYWSDKLEMRFEDAFDLKESIGRQMFGREDITRDELLQGIRKMEIERYRPPAFEAADEPGFFSRVWHSLRDRIVTPRDIEGRIARGPFMSLLLGREEFPDLEQVHRKTFKQATKDAFDQAGTRAVKSLSGRAQLLGDIGTKLGTLLDSDTPESEQLKNDLSEWGEYMAMAADQWYAENPESQQQIQPGTGFLGTTAQYILHPENILQGSLESVPMLMTAALGHITGSTIAEKVGFGAQFLPWAGRVAGIAEPVIGEEYTNARAQGLDVENALAQSYTKAYTMAVIEEWVLGEKVKIFKGQFGKAANAGFAKKTADLILGGKRAYIRGAIEEGTQSVSDRFWEMIWGDSENWFEGGFKGLFSRLTEGASEAAAAGGLLEMGMSGVFAVSGQVVAQAGRVNVREQVKRINNIRKDIKRNKTLDDQSKEEIDSLLDEKVEEVSAGARQIEKARKALELEELSDLELKQRAEELGVESDQERLTLIEQIAAAEVAEPVVAEKAVTAEITEKPVATVPGTEIEFDSVGAFGGNTVTFFKEGKRVHTVTTRNVTDAREQAKNFETLLEERAGVVSAIKGFGERVKEGVVRKETPKGQLGPEATVKAELAKDAVIIKEAQGIDESFATLREEIAALKELQTENKKLKGTTQFDATFDKSTTQKIAAKTKQINERKEVVAKKLRSRIQELADIKGLSKKALTGITKKHANFSKLTGKVVQKKVTIDQLINVLEAVETARPKRVGAKVVLSQKTEDQIAAFKESLLKANRITEAEFKRILNLTTGKGFGQAGAGQRPRPPRFISAQSFITQEEARNLLDRMHDSAEVIGITEPFNQAVENKAEIKAEMQNVRNQPPSIGDPSAKTVSARVSNAVFGTDFFDRLYSMRFYTQRLGDRLIAPIYKVYRSLTQEKQRLAQDRQKVFEFLGTLPDFDKIAADNEALQRVSDAIASKSNLENKPEFPKEITKFELRLVKEIEKIFKIYEFQAKIGKFFQHKDDLTKMPQYLKFKKGIDRALEIYDTEGVDALFDYIKTQNWGIVRAGYEPMRSVIRKISTHQMPDVAVGKAHIKVRGIEYAQQDRSILQRLKSYMRQMDTLAFLQPKIKGFVRLIGDNLAVDTTEQVKNKQNVQQVISQYLNNLKKTDAADGFVEEIMRKIYSQAITVRVLADPIKPVRNLLQNAAFSEDRGDLVNTNNQPLTPEDQIYLETFVQQDRVMMSDWAFAGEEPLNLPVIGQKRLGINKVTKWVQRYSQYPASDRLNRHWSFWSKINRVRNAFAKDQTLADKMLEARFSDMQRSEQIVALELFAKEGVDSMARFIAQVHTDNTHFLYAREDRSPAEQTRQGRLVLNLFLFARAALEKHVLQLQKATGTGSIKSRVRAARVIVGLAAAGVVTNWLWKEFTGKKHGAYDFISFLQLNTGGLELASVQKVEEVYNNMIKAVAKGDTKALAALPTSITNSADYLIPYYDLGIRAIDATFGTKNIDQRVLRSIREMIDDEYRQRGQREIDRSLLEKFQLTFGGRSVDVEESRR